ncbi:50S ribosomal protein L23 [bacterium]|nr:50S ribosomal protein L23 [bacterium]NBO35979.1 50S ribosomal protein L23 [bacterium]
MKISNFVGKLLITEKTNSLKDRNTYVFSVADSLSKHAISAHIKNLFGVDVVSVRTLIMPSKPKTVYSKTTKKRSSIRTGRFKKAYVQIKDGQKIDLMKEDK